jgi:NAD(P)-dependent dehydrogenase (short-subunit alcohol dehydrogenase family)
MFGEVLKGRIALVTGAGQGNGKAIALGMAQAGARVMIADLNGTTSEATAREIKATGSQSAGFALDVSDRAACLALADRIAKEVGPLEILVNNAGVLFRGALVEAESASHWDRTMSVNVNGPFNVTSAFLPQLRQTRGCIINIGSIQSFIAPPNTAAYSVSKGAVLQLTKALAAELAPHGVRVNGIAPGIIATAMSEVTRSDTAKLEGFLRHVPMGRVGHPEELAGAAVFLASPHASYITGVMLPVDGGFLTV